MNYYYDYCYDASTYSNSYDGLDSAIATGIGATIGSFLGFISVISIVVGVLQIIAMWKLYTKAGEMLFCVPSFDGVLQCFDQDNFMVISADSDNKMVGRHYRMVNDNDYKLVNFIRDINSTMSKELSTIGFGVQADSLLRYSYKLRYRVRDLT